MKQVSLILSILLISLGLNAQVKVNTGLSIGALKGAKSPQILLIDNAEMKQKLGIANISAYSIGTFAELRLGSFYIKPSVNYGKQTTTYNAEKTNILIEEREEMTLIEKTQYIETPLLMGFRFGHFKLEAGPLMKSILTIDSELDKMDGFSSTPVQNQFGLQGGIGVRLNSHLDLEFNFKSYMANAGSHINFYDQPKSFYSSPASFELKAVFNLFATSKKTFPSFKESTISNCNKNGCFSF